MPRKEENRRQFISRKESKFKEDRLNGKTVKIGDIGRSAKHFFYRDGWAFVRQRGNRRKVFVIEKLRFDRVEGKPAHHRRRTRGRIEYRIGYFIKKRNGKTKGGWGWGQYCPMVPKGDVPKLLRALRRLESLG